MQIDVCRSRDDADRRNRGKQSCDIGVHVPVALRRCRVAPADDEHLKAVFYEVFDNALPRREIENVELVDLRGHDDLRPSIDFASHRRVLDQLQHAVAEHDRPRRDCQVLA